jgi:hypothetical protein
VPYLRYYLLTPKKLWQILSHYEEVLETQSNKSRNEEYVKQSVSDERPRRSLDIERDRGNKIVTIGQEKYLDLDGRSRYVEDELDNDIDEIDGHG